jgi:tetratricopeptide (TPR) repeat protein
VKRVLALVGLIGLVASVVAVAERLNGDRQYRRLLVEGEQASERGHTFLAIEAFSGALALKPASMVAYYRRGEAYAGQDQFDNALRDLRAARALAPDARQPLEALGRLFERRGDYAEAARWYAQTSDRVREADPSLLYRLALARYRSGDPTGAREPLRLALDLDASMVRAHFLLALVHRDAQEAEEAIAALHQAIRLAPSFLEAQEELADLYGSLGRTAEARAQLMALAVADPRLTRSIAVAMADVRAGAFESARLMLINLASAAPADSRIAVALGRLYLARAERSHDETSIALALSALESALAGTARRSEGLSLYGRALYLSGDVAGAERLLLDAVATTPVDPEAFAFLADAAVRLRHASIARDALLNLDALEGDTAPSTARIDRSRHIGALSLDTGDWTAAVRHLTAVVRAGRDDGETLGLLARAEWGSGNRVAARATLTQARAKAPGDPALQTLELRFR